MTVIKNKYFGFLIWGILLLLLNVVNHGDFLVGVLNIIYFGVTFYFVCLLSKNEIKFAEYFFIWPLTIVPIFWYQFSPYKVLAAIFLVLLLIIYLKTKLKIFLIGLITIYLVFASIIVNDLGKLPYSIDIERTVFHLAPTDIAISVMEKNALFLPYKLRSIVFGQSVYLYVILSRFAELFLLKNIYTILLFANLYPLFKGLISNGGIFNRHKILYVIFFLPLIISASARSINVYDAYLFATPILLYFILKGLPQINRKIYYLLLLVSLVLVTSPLK